MTLLERSNPILADASNSHLTPTFRPQPVAQGCCAFSCHFKFPTCLTPAQKVIVEQVIANAPPQGARYVEPAFTPVKAWATQRHGVNGSGLVERQINGRQYCLEPASETPAIRFEHNGLLGYQVVGNNYTQATTKMVVTHPCPSHAGITRASLNPGRFPTQRGDLHDALQHGRHFP